MSHQIEVGDLVKTKGRVPMSKMGQSSIAALAAARVTKIEGYRVHVAPGEFDALGRFSQLRDFRVVDLRDLEKIDPAKGGR